MGTLLPGLVTAAVLGLYAGSSALAGANEGGFLLLHTDDNVVYTADEEGTYCNIMNLECPPDPDCEDDNSPCVDFLLNGINPTSARGIETTIIWAIAAFPEGSCPEVTAIQFGLSWDAEAPPTFVAWGPCGPFEIATTDWPTELNQGTAVVLRDGAPVGRWGFPVYWFAAYSYYGPSEISVADYPSSEGAAFADDSVPSNIDPIPSQNWGSVGLNGGIGSNPYASGDPRGACCLGDGTCFQTTQISCEGDYQGDGTACDPNPCQAGACCSDGGANCVLLTELNCEATGGAYQGDGTTCDPSPCPQIPGACCLEFGDCIVLTGLECVVREGEYQGEGTGCDPSPCPPISGACCLAGGLVCQVLTEEVCAMVYGEYRGDRVPCDPNPCDPVPTVRHSWGQIKALYR